MKEKPKRKLPKKSARAKRRYILFSLEKGSCENAKQAFDLVMTQFSLDERKKIGLWFVEFTPENGKGIVRCNHGHEARTREGIESINGAKTLKTSGTLRALRAKC